MARPAKTLTTDQGTTGVAVTRYSCTHCGEPIMSNAIQTVKVVDFSSGGKKSRTDRYIKGHRA